MTWDEELSQIATLVKLPASFEAKEYEFKLQAPGGGQKPPATIGKASLDMARFAAAHGAQAVALAVPVPGGRATLHLVVGAAEVKGMALDDDAMSVLTGASGITESSPGERCRQAGQARLAPAGRAAGAAVAARQPRAGLSPAAELRGWGSSGGLRRLPRACMHMPTSAFPSMLACLQAWSRICEALGWTAPDILAAPRWRPRRPPVQQQRRRRPAALLARRRPLPAKRPSSAAAAQAGSGRRRWTL